jgi:hypothetical protein
MLLMILFAWGALQPAAGRAACLIRHGNGKGIWYSWS